MIKGMNHVGISVADLDRAIAFYQTLFGMEVVAERAFEGGKYAEILDVKNVKGRAALLRTERLQLELFEFSRPIAKHSGPKRSVIDHGITHICLEVTDIEAEYRRLRDAGVRFHCEPLDFEGIAKATYGRDLDGNVIELWEPS